MGRFSGVEQAVPSEGGVYVEPGVYDVEIDVCKAGTTRKKLDFFIAELLVLKSDNPGRRPGSKMTWFVGIKPDTPALGDIRGFIAMAMDATLDEVEEEECEYAASDANPLHGVRLHLIATNIKLKSGKDFTKCKWESVAEPKQAAAVK